MRNLYSLLNVWWKQVNDENPQCTVTLRTYINLDPPHFKWSVVIMDWIVSAQNLYVETPALYIIAFGERALEKVSSVSQSCLTLCDPMDCNTPGFPVCYQLTGLLKLMSIKLVMPSNHFILCCPLLLLSSIFRSIRVFSNESVLCSRGPKC